MLVYLIHILCGALFLCMFPNNTFLIGLVYLLHLLPCIHVNTVFYITERKYPPWNIFFKYVIHVCIYELYIQKINLFFIWTIIYLWNDIWFLIEHAEKKLIKIDDILYENQQRISHFYHNLYEDDTVNRFHENLFDTHRLYLFDRTEKSKEISLAVQNYRKILKDGKNPRSPVEKKILNAAKGYNLFVRDRLSILYLPAVLILLLSGYVDYTGDEKMYITFSILFAEVFGKIMLSRKYFYLFSNLYLTLIIFFSSNFISINLIEELKNESSV